MPNNDLTQEQKTTRDILYCILAFTIFLSFIVDFYHTLTLSQSIQQ
jgi:hypothetical protein